NTALRSNRTKSRLAVRPDSFACGNRVRSICLHRYADGIVIAPATYHLFHRSGAAMGVRNFSAMSEGRENNLDFLRFFFAALVILSHSFPLLYGVQAAEPFAVATHNQITGGALAVYGFFMISGFLIT